MKKPGLSMSVAAAKALVLVCASIGPLIVTADAFEQYSADRNSGNCATCHGNFRTTHYVPLAGQRLGIPWPAGLHDSHRSTAGFLNGNCNACHSGSSRFPMQLGVSAGDAPFNQACTGCHSAPGLRNHHELLVGPYCSSCHVIESVGNEKTPLPPVYTAALGSTSGTTKINEPCNSGAAGTVFEGSLFDVSTVGLDNDGDGLADLPRDPDCAVTSACAPAPIVGCVAAGKANLLVDERKAGKEKLKVALKNLVPFVTQSQFGNPVSGSTSYAVCIYDASSQLRGTLLVDRAGDACGSAPCWKEVSSKGYKYDDKTSGADGIRKVMMTGGDPGKGKVVVNGKNSSASLPLGIASALQNNSQATVQVVSSDASCFGLAVTDVKAADGLIFKAVGP